MKMKLMIAIIFAVVGTGCGSQKQKSITSYRTANGYFIRNDVNNNGGFVEKITDTTRFCQLFGMAATMSSQPTPIDFKKEVAVAIVLPLTYTDTQIRVDSIVLNESATNLYYSVLKGENRSYSIRPSLVVLLDRKYDKPIHPIANTVKHENDYILLTAIDGKASATINKAERESVLFAFESGRYELLQGKLTSGDPEANIRFTQIFMPDGSADGPFGRDIQYDISGRQGLYKLSVGENMMAGDPWSGEFTIEIVLRHYVQ